MKTIRPIAFPNGSGRALWSPTRWDPVWEPMGSVGDPVGAKVVVGSA
jgi:hypothetical protein